MSELVYIYIYIYFTIVCVCVTMSVVALETSMGKIEVELYTKHAPRTCTNFATLSSR